MYMSVYMYCVYFAIRVNTFGFINVFLWQGMDSALDFLFVPVGKRYFLMGDNPRLLSW